MIRTVTSMLPPDWRCTVTVRRSQGIDRKGNQLPPAVHHLVDCLIAQQSTADPADFDLTAKTRVVLSAPPGADLRDGDEIEAPAGYFAAGRYTVTGDPARGPLGVSADLTRLTRKG